MMHGQKNIKLINFSLRKYCWTLMIVAFTDDSKDNTVKWNVTFYPIVYDIKISYFTVLYILIIYTYGHAQPKEGLKPETFSNVLKTSSCLIFPCV